MYKLLTAFVITVAAFSIQAQESIIDEYISLGLESNLALKQKTLDLNKSLKAIKEARGMFFPSLSFDARYSMAGGGREIFIPIGDLINPVYSGLNTLIGRHVYPTNIENRTIPFLRETEHDTKLRLTQPIFNMKIIANYNLKKDMSLVEKAKRNMYVQELAAEIRKSYYNYLKAYHGVEIYEKTRLLLQENLRVSRRLYETDKVTEDAVFRAEAELAELEQELAEAKKNHEVSQAYFNFLLNKPLDTFIEIIDDKDFSLEEVVTIEQALKSGLEGREELTMLRYAVEAAETGVSIHTADFYPDLNFVFDIGYQGEEYNFTTEHGYWMASFMLHWNLWNSFQDDAQREQNQIEAKKIGLQIEEIRNKIRLEITDTYKTVKVAGTSVNSAEKRLESSRKSFDIVQSKYEDGMASHIEYLDARTNLTGAEINYNISRFTYYIKRTDLEKSAALIKYKAK